MVTTSFAAPWMWLVLISGVGSMPMGGAPLPLDPVLSNIAPEECLWYAAYSGQGPADAASENQTEQLFAEPQVQAFAKEVQTQILRAVRRAGGPEREKRVIAEQAPKLVQTLLSRPFAVYLEEAQPMKDTRQFEGAFVLNAGDEQSEVETAIDELLKLVPEDGPKFATEDLAGVQWRRAPTPPPVPSVRFGWKDSYFIIAVGDKTPGQVLQRMGGSAPAWLTAVRKEHGAIQRELSLGYLNVAAVLDRIHPLMDAKDPKAWPAIEKLGLTHIKTLHGMSGYDAVACVSEGRILTDGRRSGILSLLPQQTLDKADLQLVPNDALLAFTVKLDASQLLDNVVKLASEFEPRAREDLDKRLWEIESKLGVNVREDILAALGDAWVVYLPSGDLMTSWLNAAAAVRVKDADKLEGAFAKMVSAAKAEMARHPEGITINESTVGKRKLYSLLVPAPVSPSWCVGDDWFIFGLSPQTVRSLLERKAEDSLAEAPGVSEALQASGGAAGLIYQDTPRLARSVYPWLRMGVQMASVELRKKGIEFDPTLLPTDDVIVKHLRPGITVFTTDPDGFGYSSWHSLPGGGNVAAAAPLGAALLLPAIAGARRNAQQSVDMNNMKQLAIAIHNYHAAHNKLPTDIYSKEGKPLFSWRVQLLPYLEALPLYSQLKLDEPWDSEHNRQFTSTSLAVFQSQTAPQPGKTRFLALKGPQGLLGGNKAVKFQEVIDGLSNTIAFVEAAPARAVEWAKPADIDFDPTQPYKGLIGPDGSVLVAKADGSIRRFTADNDPNVIKAYATRAGGEVIPDAYK